MTRPDDVVDGTQTEIVAPRDPPVTDTEFSGRDRELLSAINAVNDNCLRFAEGIVLGGAPISTLTLTRSFPVEFSGSAHSTSTRAFWYAFFLSCGRDAS